MLQALLFDRKVVSRHTRPVHMVVNQMAAECLRFVHVAYEWSLDSTRSKTRNNTDTHFFSLMAQRIGIKLALVRQA